MVAKAEGIKEKKEAQASGSRSKHCSGKSPMQTLTDSLPLVKEKFDQTYRQQPERRVFDQVVAFTFHRLNFQFQCPLGLVR
jgi:hypothetical protein